MPKTLVLSGLAPQQAGLLQIEDSIGDYFASLPRAVEPFLAQIAMDQPR